MFKPGITRFLLALLVVFFHISRFMFLGRFAVCSFFILSGYWITLMFENKYSHKKNPLKTFYISRIWRLFPLFYAFTIIGLIVWVCVDNNVLYSISNLHSTDKVVFWFSNLTLFTYYTLPKVNILVPAWSLDIELQFYLLFPILYYFSSKDHKKLIWIFLVSIIAFSCITITYTNTWIANSILIYLYLFVFGMLIYFKKIHFKPIVEKLCLVISLIIIGLQYIIPFAVKHYKDEASIYYKLLSFVLVALFVPVIANAVRRHSDKNDRFWGEMSFLVYLSHWVWIRPYSLLAEHSSAFMHFIYLLLFLMVTFLSSIIIYYLVDRPMERYRHKWVNRQS